MRGLGRVFQRPRTLRLLSMKKESYKFENLLELQSQSCAIYSDQNFLGTIKDSKVEYITYESFARQVSKFSGVLALHNVGVDDKVALISNSRVEWAVALFAANRVGAQLVPMYETQPENDWRYIIEHSEAKVILAATEKIYLLTEPYVNNFGKVDSVISFDAEETYLHSYKRWMSIVKDEEIPPPFHPSRDHISTIFYTPGTTGQPKGVMLSHGNLCSNLRAVKDIFGKEFESPQEPLVISSWSNVSGMCGTLLANLHAGNPLTLLPSLNLLLATMDTVQPTTFSTSPLLVNRIFNAAQIGLDSSFPPHKKLTNYYFSIARERNFALQLSLPVSSWLQIKFDIANLLLSNLRSQVLGGRLKHISLVGGTVDTEVLEFFEDIGIPLLESYGLTETSSLVTCTPPNCWEKRRFGCVGTVLPETTLRIVNPETLDEVPEGEEGEICVSGPGVSPGYLKDQEANERAFFLQHGMRFFRTGDLGCLVDKKFLRLIGRISDKYTLNNGQSVMPSQIEAALGRSNYVGQCCILGANKEYNVALIYPDMFELAIFLRSKDIPVPRGGEGSNLSKQEMGELRRPEVVALYASEIERYCGSIEASTGVKRFAFVPMPFSQENEHVTAKKSLRRHNIVKTYDALIKELYAKKVGFDVAKKIIL